MTRRGALDTVLRCAIERRPTEAVAYCAQLSATEPDSYLDALQSFSEFFAQDFTAAGASALRAVTSASDPEARIMALAATAWAEAGAETGYPGDPILDALAILDDEPVLDADSRAFVEYWLAEAALGTARLDLARQIAERSAPLTDGFLADDGAPHPFLRMMRVMHARLLAFQGKITDALAQLDAAAPAPGQPRNTLVEATRCLLLGNNSQRQAVRAIADRLERELGEPVDYLSAGCYILVSYGLIATADVPRAAAFVLLAGGTAGLERLSIIDRTLGLEMLVVAALAGGDLDAARAWQVNLEPLLHNRIAGPTIERINARVALAAGDARDAATWAGRAVEHASAEGRVVEAAEAEIILARARIQLAERGAASAALDAMVARSAGSGYLAAQKAAARELRAIGRRLRPQTGTGWDGLSARERDVALLLAEGFSNQQIAGELHLSEHTVQAHVSRVLAAFGAASRLVVAAKLSSLLAPGETTDPAPPLTARQLEVAGRIASGLSNDAIAHELGVSPKTVEKHVSEILRRWNVSSRIGIARLFIAQRDVPLRGDSDTGPELITP